MVETRESGSSLLYATDNLRIHTNNSIVKTARRHGVHMFNIMPGTSHWFQVHDQLPFEKKKKKHVSFADTVFASFLL